MNKKYNCKFCNYSTKLKGNFKRHLTIKTKYNPNNPKDVKAFNKACNILEEQGIEFTKGSEIGATEIGKKIYFRYEKYIEYEGTF